MAQFGELDDPEITDPMVASLQLLDQRLDELTEQVSIGSRLQDKLSDQIGALQEGMLSLAETLQAGSIRPIDASSASSRR